MHAGHSGVPLLHVECASGLDTRASLQPTEASALTCSRGKSCTCLLAWNTSTKPRLHHYYSSESTDDEKQLFFELYELHSNGTKVNWEGLVAAWNMHMVSTPPNIPGGDIYVKTGSQLRKHADEVVLSVRQRYRAAFAARAQVNRAGGSLFHIAATGRQPTLHGVRAPPQQPAPLPSGSRGRKKPGSNEPKTCALCGMDLKGQSNHKQKCIFCRKCSEALGFDFKRHMGDKVLKKDCKCP